MRGENLMLPFSEACERNKAPILEVLHGAFAGRLHVLEIGSGTGQHAVHFAAHLKDLVWQPTERLAHLTALESRVRLQGTSNLRAPAVLDVNQKIWPVRSVDAVFSANTLHIVSWDEVKAMFAGIDAGITGSTRHRATNASMQSCASAIRSQGSATSMRCANSRLLAGCGSAPITICPRTIGCSCSSESTSCAACTAAACRRDKASDRDPEMAVPGYPHGGRWHRTRRNLPSGRSAGKRRGSSSSTPCSRMLRFH
jgi:hypothetical protein